MVWIIRQTKPNYSKTLLLPQDSEWSAANWKGFVFASDIKPFSRIKKKWLKAIGQDYKIIQ